MADVDVKAKLQPSDPQSVGEIEQQSGHFHWRMSGRAHIWRPPTDVYVTEDAVVVRVEIAGMQDAEFSVALDGRILSIRGMRSDSPERRAYHQMEIRLGEFLTEVEIHWPVDNQGVLAEYQDGFLKVILPKAKPHRIEIGED